LKQKKKPKSSEPKGWVKNPKTLADVIQSLEAFGYKVNYRGKGEINPRKIKL
jgi:hypothetical protein